LRLWKEEFKRVDAIRLSNLTKRYGSTVAVENLSLGVRAGTMFGFLGPNGSGKTTTIGCMTGLLDPTSGAVEILGQHFTAESAAIKRRIGVMPETLGHEIAPLMTVPFRVPCCSSRIRVA